MNAGPHRPNLSSKKRYMYTLPLFILSPIHVKNYIILWYSHESLCCSFILSLLCPLLSVFYNSFYYSSISWFVPPLGNNSNHTDAVVPLRASTAVWFWHFCSLGKGCGLSLWGSWYDDTYGQSKKDNLFLITASA